MTVKYIFLNGDVHDIPTISDKGDMDTYFKVSLPSSPEDFEVGNGEGVWACASDESYKERDNDGTGIHFVKILNDSVYYPGLLSETIIPVEFRGKERPVAFYEELNHQFGQSKKDEVIRFLLPRKKTD